MFNALHTNPEIRRNKYYFKKWMKSSANYKHRLTKEFKNFLIKAYKWRLIKAWTVWVSHT